MPTCTQCESQTGHILDVHGTELICTECAGSNVGEAVADLARSLDYVPACEAMTALPTDQD